MAPEEQRQDRDGNWYTEKEFRQYYGDGTRWHQARKWAGRNTAQGNAEEFHGDMDAAVPADEPGAAPAASVIAAPDGEPAVAPVAPGTVAPAADPAAPPTALVVAAPAAGSVLRRPSGPGEHP